MPDGNFWSLLGILAVVVLILYFTYVATRWLGGHSLPGGIGTLRVNGSGEKLRLLGQLAVGRGERLVVARLCDRCYLLGVTEHSITLLHELSEEEAAQWLSEDGARETPGFSELLRGKLRKK